MGFLILGSPPFVLMAVSGKALAAGPEQKRNPRLAPCGSLDTKFNTNGGEPEFVPRMEPHDSRMGD